MKVSKTFTWDMAHRLSFHTGLCKNIHGHTYSATFYFDGELDENGIVYDFYDITKIVSPLIDDLDHSFMMFKEDIILNQLKSFNFFSQFKIKIVDFETTAENIAKYFFDKLKNHNISKVIVKETPNTEAIYEHK